MPVLPFAAVAFSIFGALLVLVGASQAGLSRALGLDLAQTGLLGSALVLGICAGVLIAGPLVDRFARRPIFLLAVLLTAISLGGVTETMGFPRAVVHVLLAGLGGGLYETVLNTIAIERSGERSVRVLTLLHSAATLGAILTPLVVGGLAAASGATAGTPVFLLVFRGVGAAHLVLGLGALGVPFGRPARGADARRSGEPRASVMNPALAALCVASFAYLGVESAITVFAIPYASEGLGLDPQRGRWAISLFWLGLLAGRIVFAARALPDDARVAGWAGGGAALVWGLGIALDFTHLEALTAVTGFALGGVFPLLVALAGRRASEAPGTAISLVAGLGSLGGFAVPWVTGVVGDRAGIRAAMGGLVALCVVIALSAVYSERLHRARKEPVSGHAPRE